MPSIQPVPTDPISALNTIYANIKKDSKGTIQLGELVKNIGLYEGEGTIANKLQSLCTLLNSIKAEKLNPENQDLKSLHDIAKVVWDSQYFKTLTPSQRKNINDIRTRLARGCIENMTVRIGVTFANLRDSVYDIKGVDIGKTRLLRTHIDEAEKTIRAVLESTDDQKTKKTKISDAIQSLVKKFESIVDSDLRPLRTHGKKILQELEKTVQELTSSQDKDPLFPKPTPKKNPQEPLTITMTAELEEIMKDTSPELQGILPLMNQLSPEDKKKRRASF